MVVNPVKRTPFLKRNPAIPKRVADTPWPNPQTAPTLAALYHGSPQHRGMSAARWSGPAMAWRDPEKMPPEMTDERAARLEMEEAATVAVEVKARGSWLSLAGNALREVPLPLPLLLPPAIDLK